MLYEDGGGYSTHLAPQELSNPDEETPQPLGQAELGATEGFTPKFHNDNLEQRKRGSSASGTLSSQGH